MEPFDTKNIKPGSIKILGNLINERRKELHLSQSDLADGICTQGLVSLIENNNASPSVDIIYNICNRLGLKISDVIMKRRTTNKRLDCIEIAIWERKYEVANDLIKKIRIVNLDTRELRCRYYCYLGDIAYKFNHDYQLSIHNFNEVLVKYSGLSEINLYTTWAHIGITKSYLKLQQHTQVQEFILLADSYLKRHQFEVCDNFKLLINIYIESIHLHQQLFMFKEAFQLGKHACKFLVSIDSMYQLGALNLAIAESLIADKDPDKAINYLDKAHHFGDYYNDHQIVSQVSQLRNLVTE